MFAAIWPSLKRWRNVGVGPVGLVFGFRRRVRITRGRVSRAELPSRTHAVEVAPLAATAPSPGLAVVVGVGPGFGHALAARLAREGFRLVLVCRDAAGLSTLINDLAKHSPCVAAIGCDATCELQVEALFRRIQTEFGSPDLVVYGLQDFGPGSVLDVSAAAFESCWRHNCFGAFLISRAAGKAMREQRAGSIILVGSTSSILGRAGHVNLAVGKFGQRALSQVLARELWPEGIHVAHVMIDADIHEGEARPHPQADPDHIAYSILAVHRQPRTAWTSELDLRPADERFWEHC